jgi:hypothetical protein
MGAHLYRDAHVGIRARLADLEARIHEREAVLTKAFWLHLEPYVRERLAELRAGLELTRGDSLQELAHAEGLLGAYLGELESWIARAPALEEAWLELPSDVDDPPAAPVGLRPRAADGHEFLRTFNTAVRETAAEVQIVAEGWWSCIARFRRRNAPFALRACAHGEKNGRVTAVSMELVTSVARATPRLVVKHESLFAAVTRVMGLRPEVEVGDASFDGLFLIQGAQQDALHFLAPKVRGFLMALARFDVPTLEIDPARQTASLSWCFEPAAAAIDAAVRTLSLIREVPRAVAFRR